jgi:hypothetical protein
MSSQWRARSVDRTSMVLDFIIVGLYAEGVRSPFIVP